MWNKLTHLVKPRSSESDVANGEEQPLQPEHNASTTSGLANSSVMSQVYEQHPNLSVFHSGSAINLATPSTSPPASPSKGSRRSMFKRSLKAKLTSTPAAQNDTKAQDALSSGQPLKLVPKKLRASLQIDTFTSQTTSSDVSSSAPTRPTSAPLLAQPRTPTVPEHTASDAFNPLVEVQPTATGSIRSILRDQNTPGTGRSVRFFSRDAYRIITPNASEADVDQDAIPNLNSEAFLEKLKQVSPERDTEQLNNNAAKPQCAPIDSPDDPVDMFSPPSARSRKPLPFQPRHPPHVRNTSTGSSHSSHPNHSRSDSSSTSHSHSSLMIPPAPADMPNLFDLSQEISFSDLPASIDGPSGGDAIAKVEKENEEGAERAGDASMRTIGRSTGHISSAPTFTSTPVHGRVMAQPRNILSPEGSVFHSVAAASPEQGSTMYQSFTSPTVNEPSGSIFFTPDASHAKTQNATAFFTPDTTKAALPVVLPESQAVTSTATQLATSSSFQEMVVYSDEELVASLREQLLLQQQLTSQFEVDLAARDELVSLLSTQLQNSEAGMEKYRKEAERRQSAMHALRRKVGELEKICRGLEEEVERSREESFERSVMDEASEGALVVLHGSIGQLKGELEKAKEEGAKANEERDKLKDELDKVEGEMKNKDQVEKALHEKMEEIQQLESKAQQDAETIDSLHAQLDQKQEYLDEEIEKHNFAESQWIEEKARLQSHDSAQGTGVEELRRTLLEKEEELKILKGEVEAQWEHAEKADEKIKLMEGEKGGLAQSIRTLEAKVEEVGSQWKEAETRRVELEEELHDAWAAKEEIEQDRDQLVEDVNFEREHAEQLTRTLQERETKLDELEQERQYAVDNVSRLEELLRQRDGECAEAQSQILEREREAESLRAEMSKMKRDHSRLTDEQTRHLDDFAKQEEKTQRQLNEAVRQKAEDDVALRSTKEQLGRLNEEVQRLKRQVHDLQQESADKEVKIVQLTKARAADKEDIEGLNIALDSKQQELELLKRKNGVKGTGGATPAPTRVGLPLHERRQSTAFVTPRSRPSSVTGFVKPSSVSVATKPSAADTPGTNSKRRSNSISNNTPTAGTTRMGPPVQPTSSSNLARSTSTTPDLGRSVNSSLTNSRVSTTSNVNLSHSTPTVAQSESRSALPVAHRRSSSIMSPLPASVQRSTSASRTTSTPRAFGVLSRSSSVTPGPRSASVLSRSSSVMSSTPEDDKENAAPSKSSVSRRTMVPA